MNEEEESLIDWFTGGDFSTVHFVISNWEITDDVDNMVGLAITAVQSGNKTALTVLKRT